MCSPQDQRFAASIMMLREKVMRIMGDCMEMRIRLVRVTVEQVKSKLDTVSDQTGELEE